jgi:hypothetical protein
MGVIVNGHILLPENNDLAGVATRQKNKERIYNVITDGFWKDSGTFGRMRSDLDVILFVIDDGLEFRGATRPFTSLERQRRFRIRRGNSEANIVKIYLSSDGVLIGLLSLDELLDEVQKFSERSGKVIGRSAQDTLCIRRSDEQLLANSEYQVRAGRRTTPFEHSKDLSGPFVNRV